MNRRGTLVFFSLQAAALAFYLLMGYLIATA